jgi:L-aminopeptidase/D-esterase-like protein
MVLFELVCDNYLPMLTNIPGIRVGHFTNTECSTGCTVVICDNGATCGVDIRGGAPGTRETALLAPYNLVDKVNAILLTGGSAFGLAAADGVMRYCEEKGYGFGMSTKKIPIVPAAVIYDFYSDNNYAPTAQDGYVACLCASNTTVAQGNVGAGTGALVGKVCGKEKAMRGGLGTASIQFASGLIVEVLVVVNAFGDVRDYADNRIVAGAQTADGDFIDTVKYIMAGNPINLNCQSNTMLGITATNANFSKTALTKVAQMAHVGVTQVVTPAHTMYDGDTFFALATGEIEADINIVGVVAAELVKKAIKCAVSTTIG